ncbi:ORF32 [Ovine gammaherpesvirus 2]|uniref:ORF32 n=1 Tax=Ovine gammaherpesvirus 2 TaxID=10398 RepID=Q2VSK9_9GAMA|nr:ORF32 [Ovine gammaherpesvirus 2]AAX58067.1 ORF32 [Ovine gammaherpesvirus 2]
MDVHSNNWRYLRHRCHVMAHLVLPEDLFADLNMEGHPPVFRCVARTIDYDTDQVTEPLPVWARYLDHLHSVENLTRGVALSIPLFLTNGMWHPFNVVLLQCSPYPEKLYYIRIFYQTIFSGLLEAGAYSESAVEELPQIPSSQPTKPVEDPLRSILRGPKRAQHNSRTINNNDSVGIQAPEYAVNYSLNHCALENSPSLRGALEAATVGLPVLGLKKPHRLPEGPLKHERPLSLRRAAVDFTAEDLVLQPLTHCFTKKKLWLCVYESSSENRPVSYLDSLSEEALRNINPLRVIQREAAFLAAKMGQFVDSLITECKKTGFTVNQQLPISIESGAANALDYIQEQFYEACFTIRGLTNETSGWIQAALAQAGGKPGLWADIVSLWERGAGTWGLRLNHKFSLPPTGALINIENLSCQLTGPHADFLEQACTRDGQVVVVYSSTAEAWLILPGGFAIKGHIHHSEEDLVKILGKYGH